MPSMHYAADPSEPDQVKGRTLNFLNDENGATPPYFEGFQVILWSDDTSLINNLKFRLLSVIMLPWC